MKIVFRLVLLGLSLGISAASSFAQDFPSKPLRLVVGYSPGGATDLISRAVAQRLSEVLGKPVVIDNVPGAAGTLAASRVVKAPADGYTLLMITSSDPIQKALKPSLPYKLETDLTPISLVAIGTYILSVHPSVNANSIAELIALARANPGKLTYGSPGIGSGQHLAGELFKSMAKVDMLHVPYKGGGDNAIAVASGHIDVTFGALPPTLPLIKAGKLKALAVTSLKRASAIATVPTLNEAGLTGYDRSGWFALTAPAGLSAELSGKLSEAVAKTLSSSEIKDALAVQGLEPQPSTPQQLLAFIQREVAQSINLVELAGLKNN